MKKVYLVGAGPGDPELITCKGRRILESADCVLYDNLANNKLLELVPRHAERIYVGKQKSHHVLSQEEISRLLVEKGRQGLNVVRLKGGDPYIFGRGGEEVEALADNGIPFEVVPGVTSPLGIGAYTGVPLTHRSHTSVVTMVTGHNPDLIDWERVGHAETLVIYMGLTALRQIAAEIVARGRNPQTPAMAVRWGTRPDQQVIVGTLETLPDLVEQADMKPPATVIIGEVVSLRGKLDWYGKLPLFGRRIVTTRSRHQAQGFIDKLRSLGADVIELPSIEIRPAADPAPLDRAIARLESYDWIIFTSANGVERFIERLDASSRDLRALRASICAIGPATRAALEALHLKVDLVPEEYVAEGLVAAFEGHAIQGKRILLPRAAVARDLVPTELARRGAIVDVVEAYHTVAPENLAETARAVLAAAPKPDWITFTSSSTVKNLVQAAGAEILHGVCVASIGPVTSATARSLGLEVAAEARVFTMDGLLAAILEAEQSR